MPKSRRACKVCEHKNVRQINRRLADPSNSARSVAIEYAIEPRTMQRHYSQCIAKVVESITRQHSETGEIVPAAIIGHELTPLTQQERAMGADVVYRMQDLQGKTLALLDTLQPGQIKTACAVIREARQNYALIARLTGKLNGASEEGARTITFQEFRTLYLSVNAKEAA